jgi:hypothetical protein
MMMQIPSSHQAWWINFTSEQVVCQDPPPILQSSMRKLKVNGRQLVRKYNKEPPKAGLDTQLSDLYKKSDPGGNDEFQADFNRLHLETKEVRTKVKNSLWKLFMGGVFWYPELQIHQNTTKLWQKIVRKCNRIKVSIKRNQQFMSKPSLGQALEYNLKRAFIFLTKAYQSYGEARKMA